MAKIGGQVAHLGGPVGDNIRVTMLVVTLARNEVPMARRALHARPARRWLAFACAAMLFAGTAIAVAGEENVAGDETAIGDEQAAEGEIHGAPAAFAPIERREEITLDSGTRLFQNPARRSARIAVVDARTRVPVLDWRGAWARVQTAETLGWVLSGDKLAAGETALPLDGLPGDLRPTTLDLDQLRAARQLLGEHREERVLGYRLYSDVSAPRFARLARVLAHLDGSVRERLGLDPAPEPEPSPETGRDEAVVIFAEHADYLRFLRQVDPARGGARRLGQAHDGLAAMSGDGLSVEQLEMLMVHEASHLVTRRRLGIGLPPWLEEGIAEDLAYHRRDERGAMVNGSLTSAAAVRISESRLASGRLLFLERSLGGFSGLRALIGSRRESATRPLADLVSMSGAAFNASEDPNRYPHAGFFVRYLLDTRRPGFVRFLAALGCGEAGDGATLLRYIESDWPILEADFSRWLDARWAARQDPP